MNVSPISRTTSRIEASEVFYMPEFKNDVEGNLSFLIINADEAYFEVTQQEARKYRGDLMGLFMVKGIPPSSQWIMMRMNGYYCSSDYDGEQVRFIRPRNELVSQIQRKFSMNHNLDT